METTQVLGRPRTYAETLSAIGDRLIVPFVFVLFFTSGFAALLYQVIWQRVLALFSGADVYSITIIVAAFMAGLGCGSLAGGYLADKVSNGWRIALFATAELSIALFAFISKWLYYDLLFLQLNHLAASPAVQAGVLFASLLWPTFFMGMSLPLLARILTRRVETAAQMIGSLYGFNTLGAAVGAFLTAWLLIRTLGFEATIHFGAYLNIFAALGAVAVAPYFLSAKREAGNANVQREENHASRITHHARPEGTRFPVAVWIAIYGLSGFIALSLEIVWFRLLGVMLKSTAFTFGNLLAIFLLGLAAGTFWGIRLAQKSWEPARVFFLLQAGISLYAALSLVVFTALLGNLRLLDPIHSYFYTYDSIPIDRALASAGEYLTGQFMPHTEGRFLEFFTLYFVLPLIFIGPPTLLMGLSFPFLQKVVQRDLAHLGRRVGWLQTANIFGSMMGAFLTGWFFLGALGTSSTLRLLVVLGSTFLVLYVYTTLRGRRSSRRVLGWVGAVVVVVALVFAVPGSQLLWAKMHGTTTDKIIVAEDGTGVSVLKNEPGEGGEHVIVYANGLGQSSIPFPEHHIQLGMIPVMLHPDPKDVAIIGLGSGATLFGAGGREETERITCIEIVAPQLETLVKLHERDGYGGIRSLLDDERIEYIFTDGREVIMLGDKKYDVIEADALRPTSAYSGNLYSEEYFTLLKDNLKPGGFAVSWAPTKRVLDTFVKVFPYVVHLGGFVLIGSNEPIEVDIQRAKERLASDFSRSYYAQADIDLERYLRAFDGYNIVEYTPESDRTRLRNTNTDLFPKDEYLVP